MDPLPYLRWLKEMAANPWHQFGAALFLGVVWQVPSGWFDGATGQMLLDYQSWAGIAFIAMSSMLLANIIHAISKWIAERRAISRRRASVLESLKTLNKNEIKILSYCLDNKERTIVSRYEEAVIRGLEAKGIIFHQGNYINQFGDPFTIPQELWDDLSRDRENLLPEPDRDKKDYIKERDTYVKHLRGNPYF